MNKDGVVKIAMTLEDAISNPLNSTILLPGSITQLDLDNAVIGSDGFVALSEKNVLISQGPDAYFVSSPIVRPPYAKP